MSTCPDCDTKLEKREGKDVMRNGERIGYEVIWFCPECKEVKKNSKAELAVMGRWRNM